MSKADSIYWDKAVESLAGAESEYVNRRYDNCANRCYYACFQGAIHALEQAGFQHVGTRSTWSHERVQAEFVRQLIQRRKVYPASLRDVLPRNFALRLTADYDQDWVSELQAARGLRRTREFLGAIESRRG